MGSGILKTLEFRKELLKLLKICCQRDWRASLMNRSFFRITEVKVTSLEEPFTEEEVKAALT